MAKFTACLVTTILISVAFTNDQVLAQSSSERRECQRVFSSIYSEYSGNVQRAQLLSALFKKYPVCYKVWDDMNRERQRSNDRYIEQRQRQVERNIQGTQGIMDMLE